MLTCVRNAFSSSAAVLVVVFVVPVVANHSTQTALSHSTTLTVCLLAR